MLRIVSMLLELIVFGMIAAWIWAVSRLVRGRRLLTVEPFGSPRPATWGPGTLLMLVILYVAAQAAAGAAYEAIVGVDLGAISAEFQAGIEKRDPTSDDSPEEAVRTRRTARDAMHLMAWNASFNALFLLAFPVVLRLTSGATLADLGLVRRRWPEQMQVGIVAGLLVTPVVYAIHSLALQIYPPRLHPVQDMLRDDFDPAMAGVAIISAVVLAPLFEETIFRGVIQGWMTRVFGEIAGRLTLAKPPAAAPPGENVAQSVPPATGPSTGGPAGGDLPAVALTSALFAAMHFDQWPTPIPLFVLAMVMGFLRQRMGSLLTPIVVHSLFNGCSTLAMLLGQLNDPVAPVDQPVPAPLGWLAAIFG